MNVSTDLNRVRASGARWMYQYVYAYPTDCGPRQPFQMEFWIPKGRKGGSWVPQHAAPAGNYRAWRKVRPHHSHADKLAHSIGKVRDGYARSVADQIALYMAWVHAKGLTRVHRFSDCKYVPPKCGNLDIVSVDPAEFIGPAPLPDQCEATP